MNFISKTREQMLITHGDHGSIPMERGATIESGLMYKLGSVD